MLPKTIVLRNDLRTLVLRRCIFFILAFASQSDVFKPAMTRAGTDTPSDEYDTYRDTGWRIRYVSRIHFFSEAKLGNG